MSKLLDDPRLTAYALGELPETDKKEFEMELKNDPKAQEEVKNIQAVANSLETELGTEKNDRLTPDQIEKIHQEIDSSGGINWKKILAFGIPATFATAFSFILFLKHDQERYMAKRHETVSVDSAEHRFNQLAETEDIVEEQAEASQGIAKTANNMATRSRPAPPRQMLAKKKMVRSKGGAVVGSVRPMLADSASFIAPTPGNVLEPGQEFKTESYEGKEANPWKTVANAPLSTFSTDVDTAAYSNMRRFLNQNQLPYKDSVRVEEFINYFNYDYPAPKGKHPFSVTTNITDSPWIEGAKIVRIGLKGKEIMASDRPESNLVFLLDVSGSMSDHNKLPLLKDAFKMLLRKLGKKDRVAIVVYAGASGMVLDSTEASNRAKIQEALNRLSAGGSTNAGAGINLAYDIAQKNFIKGGVNRVILATDGDFNVGNTNRSSLIEVVKEKAENKIFLTVLGLGMGNYKDDMLEQIANKGNGNYFYLDTLNEAKKVLVHDLNSTLVTIAKDVKIQVEFNPANVEGYRLVGYENRMLANKDFNDDKKDAGEIGAGHTVTALYEIIPAGMKIPGPSVDQLKYQRVAKAKKMVAKASGTFSDELMTVKLRYKTPEGSKSTLLSKTVTKADQTELKRADGDMKFAVAVASFAKYLRGDEDSKEMNFSEIKSLAKEGKGSDKHEYRQEFLELMDLAESIKSKE